MFVKLFVFFAISAVSSRVPMLNTTTSPTPLSQPPTQTPANIASPPSVLPLYPSVDIDAHVRHFDIFATFPVDSDLKVVSACMHKVLNPAEKL